MHREFLKAGQHLLHPLELLHLETEALRLFFLFTQMRFLVVRLARSVIERAFQGVVPLLEPGLDVACRLQLLFVFAVKHVGARPVNLLSYLEVLLEHFDFLVLLANLPLVTFSELLKLLLLGLCVSHPFCLQPLSVGLLPLELPIGSLSALAAYLLHLLILGLSYNELRLEIGECFSTTLER